MIDAMNADTPFGPSLGRLERGGRGDLTARPEDRLDRRSKPRQVPPDSADASPDPDPAAGTVTGTARGTVPETALRDAPGDARPTARGQSAERPQEPMALRKRRPAWRSPLTRRILLMNMLVLAIPVLGLLHLEQYRQSLIDSELDAMTTQAEIFSLALGSTSTRDNDNGQPALMHETTRQVMRVLLNGTTLRARVFSVDGKLVGDSFLLSGPGGQVQVSELPPPNTAHGPAEWIGDIYDEIVNGLPGHEDLPRYRESAIQLASDYLEVERALQGETARVPRVGGGNRLVLSVAVPVTRYRQVLAALMLSKDGAAIDQAVIDRRHDVLLVFAVALGVTVLLSLYLARTIVVPLHRLAEAADRVRRGKGKRERIPNFTRRHDEIGDLSGALIDMTEALQSKLEAIEGFAADVAHEIKNPLTSLRSAVETVARLDDPDQQRKLMSIILDDVQRLDRLISDISDASRLDAELARGETEVVNVSNLLETLVEVHRATLGEGGPHFDVVMPADDRLLVDGIEGRLGQVFRNLISNAVSFSPPGGRIALSATRETGPGGQAWAVISVSDQGPGIPEGKLAAIFDRFYSERPKGEKFGTHSGLGLSISKQIVEAHGGQILAENRPEGGARFLVRLPAR